MKSTITNKFFTAFILCAVALVSCNKDDDGNDADPDNMAGCKLSNIESTSGSYKEVTDVEYNAAGYVVKLTDNVLSNNIPTDSYVTTYTYNSNNQLIRETEDDGDYTTYEYNNTGTINKINEYEADGTLEGTSNLTYDANKRLTQLNSVDNGSPFRATVEYVGNTENISKVTISENNQILYTTTYENYDDKLNPLFARKGSVLLGESKNNPGKVTFVSFNGQQQGSTSVDNYTYKYNNSGYATEIVERSAGNSDYTQKFTYTGCN